MKNEEPLNSENRSNLDDLYDFDELKEMISKPKVNVEDSHVRTTFLLERELAERIADLADGRRGFKSKLLNVAVKEMLDKLKED